MSLPIHFVRRLISRRRGSVLILVVALLLLMAIIGTAFISGSRTDRYGAVQHTANTQIDLLTQGVENLLTANIVGKLYDPAQASNNFRLVSNAAAQYTNSYDSDEADLYLSSRLPGNSGAPYWSAVSYPLLSSTSSSSIYSGFDTVDGRKAALIWSYNAAAAYLPGDVVTVGGVDPQYYTPAVSSPGLIPTVAVPNANWVQVSPKQVFDFVTSFTNIGGSTVPGFFVYNKLAGGYLIPPAVNTIPTPGAGEYDTSGTQPATDIFAVGDADGDGVADAGLFKLPIGQVDGVTYFAATRVVDNAAAINASTAWSNVTDFNNAYQYTAYTDTSSYTSTSAPALNSVYLGFFRSDVGLRELLSPSTADGTETFALNQFRFHDTADAYPTASTATPQVDTSSATPVASGTTTVAASTAGFTFLDQGDCIDHQLIRRPAYPGYNLLGTGAVQQFQFLGNSVTAEMAHNFCLRPTTAAGSTVDTALSAETVATSISSTPFALSNAGITSWYLSNFNFSLPYAVGSAALPIRSILVGSNPVSNAVYGHYSYQGIYSSIATYHFGDWVSLPSGNCFVCIQTNTGTAPVDAMATETDTPQALPPAISHQAGDACWAFVPWTNVPTKTSANTATFGQLWAAYWNVMYDHPCGVTGVTNGFAQPMFGYPLSSADTVHTSNQQSNGENYSTNEARMFRSPIRDPNATVSTTNLNSQYLTPGQTMLLRSALAAINTTSMRLASKSSGATNYLSGGSPDGLDNVISRQITIPLDPADPASKAYNVMLFGATKQPYIDEVYLDIKADGTVNSIGIELCNPYPATMTLNNWYLARMNRSAAGYSTSGITAPAPGATMAICSANTTPGQYYVQIQTATGPVTIPPATSAAYGKVLLYDYQGSDTGATIPTAVQTWVTAAQAGNDNAVLLKGMYYISPADAMTETAPAGGQEIVIVRPRASNGTPGSSTDPVNSYNEVLAGQTLLSEFAPVDQIDTTALVAGSSYDYRRTTAIGANSSWGFVYPGPYSANALPLLNTYTYRHAGWELSAAGAVPNFGTEKTSYPSSITITPDATTGQPVIGASAAPAASFPNRSLQIAALDASGPNQVGTTGNLYPFGGFARDADLLQVPFIGAYRVMNSGATIGVTTKVVEMNSLPMDSAMADDQDLGSTVSADVPVSTDTYSTPSLREQIGRFCPVGSPQVAYSTTAGQTEMPTAASATTCLDFYPAIPVAGAPNSNVNWRYRWATHLFDFLSVHSPQDDYLPNADPRTFVAQGGPGQPSAVANRKPGVVNATAAGGGFTGGVSEDTVPVEGLVNINTAPYPVLASIPWLPPTYVGLPAMPASRFTPPADPLGGNLTNARIAYYIVSYRETHGPFQSIFDLMKVNGGVGYPTFYPCLAAAQALSNYAATAGNQARNVGDLVPNPTTYLGPPRPALDFEKQYLFLDRVSNLLTTRSDSFTCYVLVQGWRNVGSSNPVLVAQRRAAFILDRSGVTPSNPTAYTTFPVSQN